MRAIKRFTVNKNNEIPICPDLLRVSSFIPEEGFPWDAPRTQGNSHCVSRIKISKGLFPSLEMKREIWVEEKLRSL